MPCQHILRNCEITLWFRTTEKLKSEKSEILRKQQNAIKLLSFDNKLNNLIRPSTRRNLATNSFIYFILKPVHSIRSITFETNQIWLSKHRNILKSSCSYITKIIKLSTYSDMLSGFSSSWIEDPFHISFLSKHKKTLCLPKMGNSSDVKWLIWWAWFSCKFIG